MSTKAQSFVKLLLVFVVSLLSFSVGTYVGFKFSENRQKLAVLEPGKGDKHDSLSELDHRETLDLSSAPKTESERQQREIASVVDDHQPLMNADNSPMSDEEISKLAEEFVSDDASAQPTLSSTHRSLSSKTDSIPKKKTPSNAPIKSPAPASAHAELESASLTPPPQSIGTSKTSIATKKENFINNEPSTQTLSRAPQSLPPRQAFESNGKFTVQVSSFADEAEAKQKSIDLKHQGYNAFYVPMEVRGKKWFRVSIGLFNSEMEARSLRQDYLKENPDSAAFIKKLPVE
jgi:cell division protein FtsN